MKTGRSLVEMLAWGSAATSVVVAAVNAFGAFGWRWGGSPDVVFVLLLCFTACLQVVPFVASIALAAYAKQRPPPKGLGIATAIAAAVVVPTIAFGALVAGFLLLR